MVDARAPVKQVHGIRYQATDVATGAFCPSYQNTAPLMHRRERRSNEIRRFAPEKPSPNRGPREAIGCGSGFFILNHHTTRSPS